MSVNEEEDEEEKFAGRLVAVVAAWGGSAEFAGDFVFVNGEDVTTKCAREL